MAAHRAECADADLRAPHQPLPRPACIGFLAGVRADPPAIAVDTLIQASSGWAIVRRVEVEGDGGRDRDRTCDPYHVKVEAAHEFNDLQGIQRPAVPGSLAFRASDVLDDGSTVPGSTTDKALLDLAVGAVCREIYGCEPDAIPNVAARVRDASVAALAAILPQLQKEPEAYLRRLLTSFVAEHFPDNAAWRPLPDMIGMLTQLDNATTIARDYRARAEVAEAREHNAHLAVKEERAIADAAEARAAEALQADWIGIAKRGFETWAAKDHNRRWFRKIDGTPIPNDLTVNIAMAFADHFQISAERRPQSVPAVSGDRKESLQ